MAKRLKTKLVDKASLPYFIAAHERARRGKGMRKEIALFELNELNNLIVIRDAIVNGEYFPANYRSFNIIDPKPRTILSLPYCDRVVHQWLVEEFIKPYYIPRFIRQTYACIPGRGTHAASDCLQKYLRAARSEWGDDFYVLKMDISRFFDSIHRSTLSDILLTDVKDVDLWLLLDVIIECSPGSRGIPIGNYTSQYMANIYMNELDQYCKKELGIKYYLRYMDDFIILAENRLRAGEYFDFVKFYLDEHLGLELNRKSRIQHVSDGVDFVGYITFADYKLLRKRSKRSLERIKREKDPGRRRARLMAWKGHADHADSYHYQQKHVADMLK